MIEVTVIMPVRNVAATVAEQLRGLSRQDYAGSWELIVIDNGSTDRTVEIVESWRGDLPNVRVIDASSVVGVSAIRNLAVRVAAGSLIACCDGDDIVQPGWLRGLVEGAAHGDLVGGRIDEVSLNPPSLRWEQAWPTDQLPTLYGFLPYAIGANCCIRADVLKALRGWDERLTAAGDDIDLSWRAHLAGYRVVSAPDAVVAYRHRDRIVPLAKQAFQAGLAGRRLRRMYAGAGHELPSVAGRGAGKIARVVGGVATLPFSRTQRVRFARRAGFIAGWMAATMRPSKRFTNIQQPEDRAEKIG